MPMLLLGVIVLCFFLLGVKLFTSGNPKAMATSLRWVGGGVATLLALFLLLRGQFVIALMVAGFALWLFTEGKFRPAIFDLFSRFLGMPNGAGPQPRQPTRSDAMSVTQAREVLDVPAGADAETIKQAHHRLMLKVHPDVGGSDFLAAQINRAKQVLLDEIKER